MFRRKHEAPFRASLRHVLQRRDLAQRLAGKFRLYLGSDIKSDRHWGSPRSSSRVCKRTAYPLPAVTPSIAFIVTLIPLQIKKAQLF